MRHGREGGGAGGAPPRTPRGERGVGLMEIMVATVIAVLAVVALAYSFGTGSGLVDRYAAARLALGAAQRRIEVLGTLPASSPLLQIGTTHTADVLIEGRPVARETWSVVAWDDPADGVTGDVDLKRVSVSVTYGANPADTVGLNRLFPLD